MSEIEIIVVSVVVAAVIYVIIEFLLRFRYKKLGDI